VAVIENDVTIYLNGTNTTRTGHVGNRDPVSCSNQVDVSRIGAYLDDKRPITFSRIDELTFWSRALSEEEVDGNYKGVESYICNVSPKREFKFFWSDLFMINNN
jgi:hypothetical protein